MLYLKEKFKYRWPLLVWPVAGIFLIFLFLLSIAALPSLFFPIVALLIIFLLPIGFIVGIIHYVKKCKDKFVFEGTWWQDTISFIIGIIPGLVLMLIVFATFKEIGYLDSVFFFMALFAIIITYFIMIILINKKLILYILLSIVVLLFAWPLLTNIIFSISYSQVEDDLIKISFDEVNPNMTSWEAYSAKISARFNEEGNVVVEGDKLTLIIDPENPDNRNEFGKIDFPGMENNPIPCQRKIFYGGFYHCFPYSGGMDESALYEMKAFVIDPAKNEVIENRTFADYIDYPGLDPYYVSIYLGKRIDHWAHFFKPQFPYDTIIKYDLDNHNYEEISLPFRLRSASLTAFKSNNKTHFIISGVREPRELSNGIVKTYILEQELNTLKVIDEFSFDESNKYYLPKVVPIYEDSIYITFDNSDLSLEGKDFIYTISEKKLHKINFKDIGLDNGRILGYHDGFFIVWQEYGLHNKKKDVYIIPEEIIFNLYSETNIGRK